MNVTTSPEPNFLAFDSDATKNPVQFFEVYTQKILMFEIKLDVHAVCTLHYSNTSVKV